MDIATVQKRKFLNNIYRLLYSDGTKPSEQEVRKAFSRYFANNRPGLPIKVDFNRLQISDLTDVDILNELMVSSIFNLEVLYDAVFENNQEIFGVVTSLNNKLDGLKARRQELEAKLDQVLFANSNTDGFYYSFYDTFANVANIDMDLTTAYVDIINHNVTLPKITNSVSDALVAKDIFSNNATYTTSVNSSIVERDVSISNFDLVLDGLNDTYWNHDIKTAAPGVVSLSLSVPLDAAFTISKIDGTLLTSSPVSIYLRAVPSIAGKEEQVRVKESTEDYSRFSFSIPADSYSSITLTMVKMEPDRLESSVSGLYVYSFGIRELMVSSSYHDTTATLISKPLSIPSADNTNLAISAIGLDAQSQVMPGTSIQYYVAADSPGAGVSSFNWQKIEPPTEAGAESIVNLVAPNVRTLSIDTVDSDLSFIAQSSNAENVNELNPFVLPYSDKTAYRVCVVDSNEKFIEPYILASLGTYRHYGILLSGSKVGTELYKSLDQWKTYINESNETTVDYLNSQVTSISPGIFTANVGLLETKLMCNAANVVTHTVTKSQADFNLAIYLNGVLIADLPSGVISKSIEWNLIAGNNDIIITYDKSFSGLVSFNLMAGRSLDSYGIVFLDYFNYLDPIEFRNSRIPNLKAFTIDTVYGSREILSLQKIANRSLLKYYTNQSELITAIRYRVDLSRFSNPLQTPVLDSIRIKFKHNDSSLS